MRKLNRVFNARGHPDLNLSTGGFELVSGCDTPFPSDWGDQQAVEAMYYPHVENVTRLLLSRHGLRPIKVVYDRLF